MPIVMKYLGLQLAGLEVKGIGVGTRIHLDCKSSFFQLSFLENLFIVVGFTSLLRTRFGGQNYV